jgi:hypothetical protein
MHPITCLAIIIAWCRVHIAWSYRVRNRSEFEYEVLSIKLRALNEHDTILVLAIYVGVNSILCTGVAVCVGGAECIDDMSAETGMNSSSSS